METRTHSNEAQSTKEVSTKNMLIIAAMVAWTTVLANNVADSYDSNAQGQKESWDIIKWMVLTEKCSNTKNYLMKSWVEKMLALIIN